MGAEKLLGVSIQMAMRRGWIIFHLVFCDSNVKHRWKYANSNGIKSLTWMPFHCQTKFVQQNQYHNQYGIGAQFTSAATVLLQDPRCDDTYLHTVRMKKKTTQQSEIV